MLSLLFGLIIFIFYPHARGFGEFPLSRRRRPRTRLTSRPMKFNKRVLGPVSFYRRDGIQYRPTAIKKTFLFAGSKCARSRRSVRRGRLSSQGIYTVELFVRRPFATENIVLLRAQQFIINYRQLMDLSQRNETDSVQTRHKLHYSFSDTTTISQLGLPQTF